MNDARWLLASLGVLCGLGMASAQFQVSVSGTRTSGVTVVGTTGVIGLRPSQVYPLSVYRSYGVPVGPPVVAVPVPVPAVTVVYSPPPVVVIVPERRSLPREDPFDLRLPPIPPIPDLPELRRPVRPEDRVPARPPEPAAKPRARKPAEKPPLREPPLPTPPGPLADPKAQSARLRDLGRQAFAVREYGRAGQYFRQAAAVLPGDRTVHFLLAQARFALGKYREAVDAVRDGLKADPDWPKLRYRPAELYGDNADDFAEHRRLLREALARYPEDPDLLFLQGYFLWFDGRQDEAVGLLRRAADLGADRAAVERFLEARPRPPVDIF
jgi:Tetratricopeptide repeat